MSENKNKLFSILSPVHSLWWTNYTTIREDLKEGISTSNEELIHQLKRFFIEYNNKTQDHFIEDLSEKPKRFKLSSSAPIMRDKTLIIVFPDDHWKITFSSSEKTAVFEGSWSSILRIIPEIILALEHFKKEDKLHLQINSSAFIQNQYEHHLRKYLLEDRNFYLTKIQDLFSELSKDYPVICQNFINDFQIKAVDSLPLQSLSLEDLNDLSDNLSSLKSGLISQKHISHASRVHKNWCLELEHLWKIATSSS